MKYEKKFKIDLSKVTRNYENVSNSFDFTFKQSILNRNMALNYELITINNQHHLY